VHLEHILRQIQADCGDLHRRRLPHVPQPQRRVWHSDAGEGPSTPSILGDEVGGGVSSVMLRRHNVRVRPLEPAAAAARSRRVTSDPGAQQQLEAMIGTFAPALAGARIVARQACYRPVTGDGLPVMGRVPGFEDAYVATGHSVWGMLNAPATGEAMAELIFEGGTRTVDISAFDPARSGLRT
jgi:glycine/D-amino acid oxidase-like deaminating enzyme